jgi:hypothetical protein
VKHNDGAILASVRPFSVLSVGSVVSGFGFRLRQLVLVLYVPLGSEMESTRTAERSGPCSSNLSMASTNDSSRLHSSSGTMIGT